jgi:genome maintenance exonuclease 1
MDYEHIDLAIETPNLKELLVAGKRFYKLPDKDIWVPSVTTVTGWKDREKWKKWREENADKSRKILSRGTAFHKIMEDHLNNKEPITESKEVGQMYRSMKKYTDKYIRNVVGLELPLYGEVVPMAGRADCIAEFDGELAIIDFKTTQQMKPAEWCLDYFVQCTAYALMFNERTNIPIKKIVIMMVDPNGLVKIFVRNPMKYVKELKSRIDYFYAEFNEEETVEEILGGHTT